MRAYNLFRATACELYCAVPEDYAVPAFVTGAVWEFAGKVGESDDGPLGFDPDKAALAVRFNGFYVFPELPAP